MPVAKVIAALCAAYRPAAVTLTSAQLSAVCAPVAVGIGIIVAYLVLDRFRYHKRIIEQAEKLTSVLKTPTELLRNADENMALTQIERNFLAIEYLCNNTDLLEDLERHKKNIFNGGLDTTLHALLRVMVHWSIDRWLSIVVCAFLCVVEIIVSYVLFTMDTPPQWMGYAWVRDIAFLAVCISLTVPALSFVIGETIMGVMRSSVKRWIEEETTRQKRSAEVAAIPPLDTAPAPPAA